MILKMTAWLYLVSSGTLILQLILIMYNLNNFEFLFERVKQRVNEKPRPRGGAVMGRQVRGAGWVRVSNSARGAVTGCQMSPRVTL